MCFHMCETLKLHVLRGTRRPFSRIRWPVNPLGVLGDPRRCPGESLGQPLAARGSQSTALCVQNKCRRIPTDPFHDNECAFVCDPKIVHFRTRFKAFEICVLFLCTRARQTQKCFVRLVEGLLGLLRRHFCVCAGVGLSPTDGLTYEVLADDRLCARRVGLEQQSQADFDLIH